MGDDRQHGPTPYAYHRPRQKRRSVPYQIPPWYRRPMIGPPLSTMTPRAAWLGTKGPPYGWADSPAGIMRMAATAPRIESLPSIIKSPWAQIDLGVTQRIKPRRGSGVAFL